MDTDVTPVAKDSERWQLYSGARYAREGEVKLASGSTTSFEADLFDIAFSGEGAGLAAGSICRDSQEPQQSKESPDAYAKRISACTPRVPVIYTYTADASGAALWQKAELPGSDRAGYVGAIEWIAPGRALAVGGTGRYPRRELSRGLGEDNQSYLQRDDQGGEENAAGMGRAWLYEQGAWRELEVPAGMRGLSALDVSPRPTDCPGAKTECAFAGALRQLWRFQDGAFTQGISDQSPAEQLDRAELFDFRVRDLMFASGAAPAIRALAVTSGCCAQDPLQSGPRVLLYDGTRWYVRQHTGDPSNVFYQQSETPPPPKPPRATDAAWGAFAGGYGSTQGTVNDQMEDSCFSPCPKRLWEKGFSPFRIPVIPPLEPLLGPWPLNPLPGPPPNPVQEPTDPLYDQGDALYGELEEPYDEIYSERHRELDRASGPYGGPKGTTPESFYSLQIGSVGPGSSASFQAIATPGGPVSEGEAAEEPASQLVSGQVAVQRSGTNASNVFLSAHSETNKLFTTLRLHSFDASDSVGVLRQSGQGAAFGPQEESPDRSPSALAGCPIPPAVPNPAESENLLPSAPKCDPDAERFIAAYGSLTLFKLPSYALNSIDVLNAQSGSSWAVGDHGAILRRAGITPPPPKSGEVGPRLGKRGTSPLPDGEPYARKRPPLTDKPGVVSPFGVRVEEPLAEPRLVSWGGGAASEIVMSRDGSEGFAFSASSLSHFDGSSWVSCPADLACAGIYSGNIVDATRVPLENDSDPTNDEDLEVAALTGAGVFRYSSGRGWWRDESAKYKVKESSPLFKNIEGNAIAFTAPDDGWVVRQNKHTASAPVDVWHFDGERWWWCTPGPPLKPLEAPEACGDPDRRLRINPPRNLGSGRVGLATAGERTYFFSIREAIVGVGKVGGLDLSSIDCAVAEVPGELRVVGGVPCATEPYPLILYHERGGNWQGGEDSTPEDGYNPSDGGWDPGCVGTQKDGNGNDVCAGTGNPEDQGRIFSLAVAQTPQGDYEGWALGQSLGGSSPKGLLTRIQGGELTPWSKDDAAAEGLRKMRLGWAPNPDQQLTLPSPDSAGRSAFIVMGSDSSFDSLGPALAFNELRQRWEALPTPWIAEPPAGLRAAGARTDAVAPDNQGGFWVSTGVSLHQYTDHPPKPVFDDVPSPAGSTPIAAMAGGADGSIWLADRSASLYRYDRITGWSPPTEIPGWDPPRASTVSRVNDLAIGPDGSGIAVGEGGRIAELSPDQVKLANAAGVVCDAAAPAPPCGTGRDLLAAAVAPDGSALAAGKERAILWRPPSGEFRRVAQPEMPSSTTFIDTQMPRPDSAYLLTSSGQILRGQMSAPGQWSWSFDYVTAAGQPGSANGLGTLAIDAEGHGYAAGGFYLLERTPESERPWRPIATLYASSYGTVALPAGGGEGALVAPGGGGLLTLVRGEFELAQPPDPFDPLLAGAEVRAISLLPGSEPGDVEAWALVRGVALASGVSTTTRQPPEALLHYASDLDDPLLSAGAGVVPLPDVPAPRAGELSFAAFGKQDCHAIRADFSGFGRTFGAGVTCPAANGSNLTNELIPRRIGDEIVARSGEPGGPEFALFSGDVNDAPGRGEPLATGAHDPRANVVFGGARGPLDPNAKHRRWLELVAEPLLRQGVPVFGAIGGQDLALHGSEAYFGRLSDLFGGGAIGTKEFGESLGLRGTLNLPWRQTMGQMPAPWQGDLTSGPLSFDRLGGAPVSREGGTSFAQEVPNVETPGLRASPGTGDDYVDVTLAPVSAGGGATHYAVDVTDSSRPEGQQKVARIVVVDTSLGSLAAADPVQQPQEAAGQLRWLRDVLCFDGSLEDTNTPAHDCTREPTQRAIVLSNTPTYSYGPISPDELQADAAAFEAVLIENQADVVISGRVGWNGRYWALAPGVHSPCPGEGYRADEEAPSIDRPEVCGRGSDDLGPDQATGELPDEAEDAAGLASRAALPFVVSSTAGGHFNQRAERGGFAAAEQGFWRGYSIVRLSADRDPAKTIVEQRPILDWVGLRASDPAIDPRGTLKLESFAREAFGIETSPRYYEIPQTQAITHRYHLLLADPEEPWRACLAEDAGCATLQTRLSKPPRSTNSSQTATTGSADGQLASAAATGPGADNPCDPYLCLSERIGEIEATTGEVTAGNGKYPDTFAIASLSVGEHVATQALVFKRSPSFVVNPARAQIAPPVSNASAATSPQPPPPPSVPKPNIPQSSAPEPPALPGTPPLSAAQAPEPRPPAPPAPPPPAEQPSPLDLTVSPQAIAIATPTAVIQPPTPPVNPAPPGGARREARQRQAAAQKSGADNEATDGVGDLGGDRVDSPNAPGTAFTRHDHSFTRRVSAETRAREPSFTPLRQDSPSASAQGILYGGGITLLAAIAALGWTYGRPTPRRRPPEVPAPALSRNWKR